MTCPELEEIVEPGMNCTEVVKQGECCPMYECVKDTVETTMASGSLVTTSAPSSSSSVTSEADKENNIDNIEMDIFGDKEEVTASATAATSSINTETTTGTTMIETSSMAISTDSDIEESSETELPGTESTMIIIEEAITTTTSSVEDGSHSDQEKETTTSAVTEAAGPDTSTIISQTNAPDVSSQAPNEDSQTTIKSEITTSSTELESGVEQTSVKVDVDVPAEEENEIETGDNEQPPTALPAINMPSSTEANNISETTVKVDSSNTESTSDSTTMVNDIGDLELESSTAAGDITDLSEGTTIISDIEISSSTPSVGSDSSTLKPSEAELPIEGSGTTIAGSDPEVTTPVIDNDDDFVIETEKTDTEGSGSQSTMATSEISSSTISSTVETTEGSGSSLVGTDKETTTVNAIDELEVTETIIQVEESSGNIDTETGDEEDSSSTTLKPESSSSVSVDSCIVDGIEYKNFDKMPSSDPCELCFCQFGAPICAIEECPKPQNHENCTALPPPEGKCCPEEYSCRKY